MKTIILLLTTLCCISCQSDDARLSEMKSPVRIVATNRNVRGVLTDGTVTVRDTTGRIETFANSGLSVTLSTLPINTKIK